jgi:hypothetical protein
MIVKPQDAIALSGQEPIPARIPSTVIRLKMLSTIDFDHQHRRVADEIHDVAADRSLAAETCSIHSVSA